MDDLISRQDAIELVMQYCPDDDGTCSKADEDIRNLLDELENLPPAQPRLRGRWVAVDSYSAFGGDMATWYAHGNPTAFWYCSFCREQNYIGEDGEPLLTDFCPCCGADMREEEEK